MYVFGWVGFFGVYRLESRKVMDFFVGMVDLC